MRFCHSLKAVLIDNSDEDNTHAVRCTSSVLKHLLTVFVKKKQTQRFSHLLKTDVIGVFSLLGYKYSLKLKPSALFISAVHEAINKLATTWSL